MTVRKRVKQEIRVGLFVLVAVALFVVLIFSVGERTRLLAPKYRLTAYFHTVSGLVPGAPVMLSGVDVGSVEDISLQLDPTGKRVRVSLKIEKAAQDKIRADSVARIETMGLLGDKYIEITMGSYDKPILQDGKIIRTIEPLDYSALLARGQSVLFNLDDASRSLAQILGKIDKGQGLAGAVVNERTEFKEAIDNFAEATKSLNAVLAQVKKGRGTLGMLLYDKKTRQNVGRILSSFEDVATGIRKGTGTLGKLVKDETLYRRLANDLGESASLLRSLLQQLSSGKGLLPKIISGKESKRMLDDLSAATHDFRQASLRLKNVVQKIDSGQGTLGKLINDPSIYNDLADILRGAKQSWFFKRWIKSALKKGEKQRAREKKKKQQTEAQ